MHVEPERSRSEGAQTKRYDLRSLSPRTQVAVGAVMCVGIALAAIYALVLGAAIFGHNVGIGWWFLFFGTVAVCGSATPIALNLLRSGSARLGEADTDPRMFSPSRTQPPRKSALAPAVTSPEERQSERQLLEAIERHGEITPTRAALETTLTVAEADRMLSDLAKAGHLEVRVEGRRLVYSLL